MAEEDFRAHENPDGDYAHQEITDLVITETASQEFAPAHFYHRDPGYRPWLRKPNEPKKPTRYEEILAIMEKYVNYAVIGSRVTLVFAIVIVLDFFMAKVPNEVEIVGYKTSLGGTIQMQLSDQTAINVSKKATRKLKGKFLTVDRTRIFSVPYKLTDKENHTASLEISFYGNFIFGPIVLLLTSLVGVLYRKGFELRFNLGVASVVLSLLNIAFMHVHEF